MQESVYTTHKEHDHLRLDLQLIGDLIADRSSVLDLGCGSGELLQKLIHEKKVQGHGVEISEKFIYDCIAKGVPVVHANLDEGLFDYPDHSFDYVILSRTLQVVRRPTFILKEMLRVGKICIVSLPNFGHWKIRGQLFFLGRMPKTGELPFEWYETPNIHLSTIKDFKAFCRKESIQLIRQINLGKERKVGGLANLIPNLFAELAIFVLQNK